jgi:hypothetical protein
MAQFVENFNDWALDANPIGNGWTMRSGNSFATSIIYEDTTSPCGNNVWRLKGENMIWHMAYYDDSPSDSTTIEILALVKRIAKPQIDISLAVRLNSTGNLYAYAMGLRNNTTEVVCRKWIDGTRSVLNSANHNFFWSGHDDWVWIRTQATGTTVRSRVWLDGDSEPETWLLSETNEDVASGGAGFSYYEDGSWEEQFLHIAYYSVGTGGDNAPGPDDVSDVIAISSTDSDPFSFYSTDGAGTNPITRSVELSQDSSPEYVESASLTAYLISQANADQVKISTVNEDAGVIWQFSKNNSDWFTELTYDNITGSSGTPDVETIYIRTRVINDGTVTANKSAASIKIEGWGVA